MAKVKIKNEEQLKTAKKKLRGNVSFAKTRHGIVAKKWPAKKVLYKAKKEKISGKLQKGKGVRDQVSMDLTVPSGINVNKKILASLADAPYFVKDNFVLYHGDSIELLKSLPENSIDMIFADPPYNLSNGGFTVHAGRMVSVNKGEWDRSRGLENDYDFHLKWLDACKRVLKPNGTLWVSGTYHSIYQCGYAMQRLGYHILNDIAWFKPNAAPNLSCRFFTASHETLIWARKEKKAKHTFNYDRMKNGKWPGDFFKKENSQMRSVWHIPESESVWTVNPPRPEEKKFGKHPTQKPVELLRRIVLASTNENDVILDPFTGSSTTGIAAASLGRKFVGMDKDENFLELSKKRFEELKNNKLS